jgi:hypothetical protein
VPSVGRQRGRHRAPTLWNRFANFITIYALIALVLGAIFAIGWDAIGLRSESSASSPTTIEAPILFTDPPPDNKDCKDFFDQEDAQKYFIAQGGPASDPDALDLDKDGKACNNYPYSISSAAVKEPNSNDQQS